MTSVDGQDAKALDDVETYGCHILSITDNTGGPDFCYSIGINKTADQPDVLIFGLNPDVAQFAINQYNDRVRQGEVFNTKLPYHGFLDACPVYFVAVPQIHFAKYLGWGRWFYGGDDFRVMQMIYPDKITGGWPWSERPNADYLWYQPVFGLND
ncbi:MAG: DUF4262 domain-containing protein [Cypionkella sp.]|nr:DUF4262 domain-containing protein [Cypionkella sp.]